MIGNDVVDLVLARQESNWHRKGYLDKIFTTSEQQRIKTAPNQDLMVWNLWSRKEAAYKILVRETGREGLLAYQLECDYESENCGTVRLDDFLVHTQTQITGSSLHTIALSDPRLFAKVVKLDRTAIEKRGRLPFWKGTPASVSHHGLFEEIVGVDL